MFHNEIIAGLKILQLSRHPSDRIDLKIYWSRKRAIIVKPVDTSSCLEISTANSASPSSSSSDSIICNTVFRIFRVVPYLPRCTWIAFALASSKAVTHFCLSTSEEALKVTTISDSAENGRASKMDDPMMVTQQYSKNSE